MLFRLPLSTPFSFILFSILFLSSSFLISSWEALRRRFFQRARFYRQDRHDLITV